jgi:hydrogenase maturation protease
VKHILIAGIGNIFLGDDAFGCDVARELAARELPAEVTVRDFGIKSYDLAYALAGNHDAIILVDATPRGDVPGTTYLVEIDPRELAEFEPESPDAHTMNPVNALKMAQSVAPVTAKIYLVGCEPAKLESEDGDIGLSEPVQRAIPQAIELIERVLIQELARSVEIKKVEVIA